MESVTSEPRTVKRNEERSTSLFSSEYENGVGGPRIRKIPADGRDFQKKKGACLFRVNISIFLIIFAFIGVIRGQNPDPGSSHSREKSS